MPTSLTTPKKCPTCWQKPSKATTSSSALGTPPEQGSWVNRCNAAAARDLLARGLLYPCTCTRREIDKLAPRLGPDGAIYPGTCKGRLLDPAKPAALRLDLDRALAEAGDLTWADRLAGEQAMAPGEFGDVVLVRKDLPASYHLAATLDDAADGVTLVTRGKDLFHASHIHRLLQALLGLSVPQWHHHPLLLDRHGRKLAKRRGSPAISDYREAGDDGRAWAQRLRQGEWPLGISRA